MEAQTYEGGTSFVLSDKQELIKLALTSFIQNDFYSKYSDKIDAIQRYCSKINYEWLFKLSAFSRNYWLRTINHIIFVEAVKQLSGKSWSRKIVCDAIDNIVHRPDELMDILWYYAFSNWQHLDDLKISNLLKYWLKYRLSKFDEYSIAKYKWSWNINIYDLVNLLHPKSEVINKLMKWELKPADTWEVAISEQWNNKESWERLMSEWKLWALATIRNLRNMMKVWIEPIEHLDKLNWRKVFPFQALQALDVLEQEWLSSGKIYDVVMKNIKKSFLNITDHYKWKIAIWIDTSWSMYWTLVSKLSKLDRVTMAIYYWVLLAETFENADLYQWSNECKLMNKNNSIQNIKNTWLQWWTQISSFTKMIKWKWYDYAIVITDEQIADKCINVCNKQTIIWWLHDYANTISNKKKWIVYFTWYNDIMWKIWASLSELWKIEEYISVIPQNDTALFKES